MSEDQVFSEKQASEIFQMAARLQEEKADPQDGYAPGLTKGEMIRIAQEAGIDPQYLDAAIRASTKTKPRRRLFDLVEEDERVVDAELAMADFDVVTEVVKPARTRRHPPRQVGRTLTLQTRFKGGMYGVEVSARNGRTRVKVTSVPFMAYLVSLHPAIIVGCTVSTNLSNKGQIAEGALAFLLIFAAGILGFLTLVRRGQGRTGELAEIIADAIREETAKDLRANLTQSPMKANENLTEEVRVAK